MKFNNINDVRHINQIFKKLINNQDVKRIINNFISLSVLRGANYILPLITLPYLTRVIGAEKYGLISFAGGIINYFINITDYGFNYSATREISIHKNDRAILSDVLSSVLTIKMIMTVICFVILLALILYTDKINNEWMVFVFSFGTVIGNMLIPVWFFQGVQEMKFITIANISAKVIFTISIFIFIHSEKDYLYVPLLSSLGYIISGIFCMVILLKNYKVSFKLVKFQALYSRMKDGWSIFLSSMTGNLYGQGTVVILGIFSTNIIVGYYSVAEKLVKAIVGIFNPFSQAIFPYLSSKAVKLYELKKIYNNLLKYFIVISICVFGVTIISHRFIYLLASGFNSEIGVLSFKILSVLIPFSIINVIMNSFIISLKMDRLMLLMYITVGLSFVVLCMSMTYLYDYKGTAFSIVIVEITMFIWSLMIVRKGFQNV